MARNLQKIESFFAAFKPVAYKKRQIIMRPAEVPQGVYHIEKGYLKVYSITQDGEEKLHIVYGPSDIFPLIWVFNNVTKNLFYEALDDVTVTCAKREAFLAFLKKDPGSLFTLANHIIDMFNVFSDRVDNLELTKAYPRLVARLLFLSNRFGMEKQGKIRIQAPLTHKDIANSINMTRETASREFEKLEKKGLVSYENHLIVIHDRKKLEGELQHHYERKPL